MFVFLHRYGFCIVELLLLWFYMKSFKDSKIKMNFKYASLILGLSFVCTSITSYRNGKVDLIAIIGSCIILAAFVPSIIRYKIGMLLSFLAIGMLIQFEIWSLYGAFPDFVLFAKDESLMLQRTLIFAGQSFTILFMSLVYGNQKICLKDLSEGILIAIDVYSFISVTVCTLVWSIAKFVKVREVYYACLLIVFSAIACFYIFLYLIMKISKGIKEMLLKQRTIMVLQERGRFIEEVNEKCEYISRLKHNLKHRIVCLWHAFESGEKDTIRNGLKEIQVEVDEIDKNIYTKNLYVNSLLRYAIGKAKQNGIDVHYNVDLPLDFSLNEDDLCVLLGNLLDNAIEACQKLNSEKRFIDFTCKLINRMLVIKVENSKLPNEVITFKSTKRNHKDHGYGLKSIDEIARRYDGQCVFKDKKETFFVLSTLNVEKYIA